MPQVSRFYAIIILIFFDDHAPPHFLVKYSEFSCKVSIVDLSIIAGYIPQRAYALVLEWASLHRTDLLNNWELAQQHQELIPIEPLK